MPMQHKLESIASSAVRAADKVSAKLIVCITHTGKCGPPGCMWQTCTCSHRKCETAPVALLGVYPLLPLRLSVPARVPGAAEGGWPVTR